MQSAKGATDYDRLQMQDELYQLLLHVKQNCCSVGNRKRQMLSQREA